MKTLNEVTLLVGGMEYGGWKSVRIEAGIDRQARSFDLEVTSRWPGNTNIASRIKPGDVVQVKIGIDLVLTGYVDATPIKYDGKSYSIGIKGRSKTADLVDCCPVDGSAGTGQSWLKDVLPLGVDPKNAAQYKAQRIKPSAFSSQYRQRKLEAIAATLAKPYGIKVFSETDTGKVIPDFTINTGDTVFECIDRMMRERHVLSTDNANGDLVFIEVGNGGSCATALELGRNILSGSASLDYKNVFSEYVCKGQRAGSDEESGDAVAGESASVVDTTMGRRRVLVLHQAGQADGGTCHDRVAYEQAHRAGKALETDYVVSGWREEDGTLWQPNKMVRVRDGLIGFDVDMLIVGVSWILDAEGQRTELKVGPPDGYLTKAKKKGKGGGKSWGDVTR